MLALPDILTTQPGLAMCLNFLQQPSTQLEDGVELDIKVLKKVSIHFLVLTLMSIPFTISIQ